MGYKSEVDYLLREVKRLSDADAKRVIAIAYVESETRKEIRLLEKRVHALERVALPFLPREDKAPW